MSNTTGRPTLLTPAVKERITTAIQLGATYEHAALYGGIGYTTFRNWIIRGEAELERRQGQRVKEGTAQWEKEQPFVEFLEAVKSAEGQAVIGWLAKIEKAASDGNWQAAAWKAERRYPQDYGRVNRTELTGAEGGEVVLRVRYADDPAGQDDNAH